MNISTTSVCASDGSVTNQDAYRDCVTALELQIPSDLVTRLRDEIIADYHPGKDDEERRDFAYGTACPQIVKNCTKEWSSNSNSLPLAQLSNLVVQAMNRWFRHVDMGKSFMPPQIAVRTDDDVHFGPHVDGLTDGANTEVPNVPFAVVGIYLDDVAKEEDGALLYWPTQAEIVREKLAMFSGPQLAKSLLEVGEACNDLPASVVLGRAGHAYLVGGNVPHCNHQRSVEGKRVAVYFRVYVNAGAS